jgi:hypothetical protein
MVKICIDTTSTTLPGDTIVVKQSYAENINGRMGTKTREKVTNRPIVIQQLYLYFCSIDLHDTYRQGYLRMGKAFITKHWDKRLFTTLFGMGVVDSFKAFTVEGHKADSPINFFDFLDTLAYQLIHKNIDEPTHTKATEIPAENDIPYGVSDIFSNMAIFDIIFLAAFIEETKGSPEN